MGPDSDLLVPKSNFRFAPKSGLKADVRPCPKSAITGLMHRSKKALFDHFIGLGEYRRRHREAECFGGLQVDH